MRQAARKKQIDTPVEGLIRVIRGQEVMLDEDIAGLYGVETKALNRAVKRNISRFPADLMFHLTSGEAEFLRCQIGTSKKGRGGRRYLPYAFTEHGVVMFSAVLNSERAVQMSLAVVRAFVRMQKLMTTHKELAMRVEKIERGHERMGSVIEILAEDIDRLTRDIDWIKNPPLQPKRRIGFFVDKEAEGK
jgi:phage regulator Rha-like protein